jgi:hypothetical protein
MRGERFLGRTNFIQECSQSAVRDGQFVAAGGVIRAIGDEAAVVGARFEQQLTADLFCAGDVGQSLG